MVNGNKFGCLVLVDCPLEKAFARDLGMPGTKQGVNRIAVVTDAPYAPQKVHLGQTYFNSPLTLTCVSRIRQVLPAARMPRQVRAL